MRCFPSGLDDTSGSRRWSNTETAGHAETHRLRRCESLATAAGGRRHCRWFGAQHRMSVMRDRPHRAPKVVFLPGASGDRDFWAPVANQLPSGWRTTLLSWPGAGDQPHNPRVRGFDDLIALVAGKLDDWSDLVAQSMGGVVAIGIALHHPEKVRRLVLGATSGGIDVAALGAADWRTPYQAEYPRAAPWICDDRVDYTDALARLDVP